MPAGCFDNVANMASKRNKTNVGICHEKLFISERGNALFCSGPNSIYTTITRSICLCTCQDHIKNMNLLYIPYVIYKWIQCSAFKVCAV